MKKTVADEIERVKSASGKVINEKKTKKSKTDVKRHEFDQLVSLKDIATLNNYPSPVKVLHRLRVRISNFVEFYIILVRVCQMKHYVILIAFDSTSRV